MLPEKTLTGRPAPAVPAWLRPAPLAVLRRGVALLALWHWRARSRGQLARLDDRMLRDMGIRREDARAEASKPFWIA